jgi:ABC-type nitrate/sulfonate/bicarbonate transport system substrate-binding protein
LFLASVAAAIVALAVFGGAAASAPVQTTEVRVVTLPIANGFPLDLGIRKGFFAQERIEIKKTTLQSGNDVVLAMANNNGDIGYLGFVPMFIAVTNNIPMTLVAASEWKESAGRHWRTSWQAIADHFARPGRKTIAVAPERRGRVMIKAALELGQVDASGDGDPIPAGAIGAEQRPSMRLGPRAFQGLNIDTPGS